MQLFSRDEDSEQDIKDIEAWLKNHKLFDGFHLVDGRWTKEFKFPEEENELYEFVEKLINLLEKYKETIYSGK